MLQNQSTRNIVAKTLLGLSTFILPSGRVDAQQIDPQSSLMSKPLEDISLSLYVQRKDIVFSFFGKSNAQEQEKCIKEILDARDKVISSWYPNLAGRSFKYPIQIHVFASQQQLDDVLTQVFNYPRHVLGSSDGMAYLLRTSLNPQRSYQEIWQRVYSAVSIQDKEGRAVCSPAWYKEGMGKIGEGPESIKAHVSYIAKQKLSPLKDLLSQGYEKDLFQSPKSAIEGWSAYCAAFVAYVSATGGQGSVERFVIMGQKQGYDFAAKSLGSGFANLAELEKGFTGWLHSQAPHQSPKVKPKEERVPDLLPNPPDQERMPKPALPRK